MEMDAEQSGHVSKRGFMQFLRNRPQLRRLLMHAGQEAYKEKMDTGSRRGSKDPTLLAPKEAEALEMRRLLRLLKEIDEDGNGTLEFEEFEEFWRKAGLFLEYKTKENPRERIAVVLGQIHEAKIDGEEMDSKLIGQLSALGKEHLNANARRKSEDLTNACPTSITSNSICGPSVHSGRRNSETFKNTGISLVSMPAPVVRRKFNSDSNVLWGLKSRSMM